MRGGDRIKIKLSNRKKLEQLYTLYEGKMYTIAYSIVKNVNQAEDIVQDSFIKLSDYLDWLKDPDSYQTKALITKIVKTTAINQYRKNQQEAGAFEQKEEQDIYDPNDRIEQKLMSIYNVNLLQNAAKDMPDIYKELIRLRFYNELSNQEIADITGVDTATVRKRYERAKKYLYDHIMQNENVEGGGEFEKGSQRCTIQFR